MFKVQLTANISVGKYFYDIMHFFFRLVWNKEMFYCHCFQLWSTICQYQSGMTEIVWGTAAFGLCRWYLFCLGKTKYHGKKSWRSISGDPMCLGFPRTVLVLLVTESPVPLYCNVLGCPTIKSSWILWLCHSRTELL